MQICCHFRSRQPGWERCRNRLPRRGSHIPSPWARPFRRDLRPFRRDLSVHDKAGERATRQAKGHFAAHLVRQKAIPPRSDTYVYKEPPPQSHPRAHLLSVLPPHNTCPPRKAKAPVSAISPFPHKSYSAASPQFSPSRKCAPSRNAPPPVNATKPPRHCAHSGKMPESSLFRATKGKFAGIHCARGGEMRESGPCRAAKGKSAGIHCARGRKTPESSPYRAAKGKSAGVHSARGDRNRHPQQANTQPQICENIKTSRPQEKVFPFHGVGFRENVPCLRCTKSNA